MDSHAGGISMIAFVVAVGVSMGYYQFVYVPQANAKPILPDEILNPPETKLITIAEGSAVETNPRFFFPEGVQVTIGIDNRIRWENEDSTFHTVTTDTDYDDLINGVFDSRVRPEEEGGPFVNPGETYEFVFTKVGQYPYHCEPHPWMQGEIEVIENFA